MIKPLLIVTLFATLISSAFAYSKGHKHGAISERVRLERQFEEALEKSRRIDLEQIQSITDLNSRVNDLKRMHGNACVPVPARKPNASSPNGRHVGADEFLDFGRDCEEFRRWVKGCQDFLRERK